MRQMIYIIYRFRPFMFRVVVSLAGQILFMLILLVYRPPREIPLAFYPSKVIFSLLLTRIGYVLIRWRV